MKHLIPFSKSISFFFCKEVPKLIRFFALLILMMGFAVISKSQTNISAIQSGQWDDPATWDNGIPTAGDDVIIGNGISVIINSTGAVCNTLLIGIGDGAGNGEIVFSGSSSLTVNGDITLGETGGATGTISMDTDAVLSCRAVVEGDPNYSGIFDTNLGTVIFNGSFTLPYNMFQFNNLVINNGTVSCGGRNLSIGGDLTINNGATLDLMDNTANRNTIAGTFTVNNGGKLRIGGGGTIPANFSNHVIGASSTIEYYGVTQTVATLNSGQNYGNLIIAGSGLKEVNGAIGIAGDLTINGGIFSVYTFTANRISAGGTLTVANGATLRIAGNGSIPANFSTHVIGATSTIDFNGTSPQNIPVLNSFQKYGNLNISSSVKTLTDNISVAGTLSFAGSCKLTLGSNTLSLEGAVTGMSATRTFTGSSNSSMVITGAFDRSLFFDATTLGTTNLLNTLTLNHGGNISTLGSDLVVNNGLNITSGKLAISSRTLTIKGNIVNTVSEGIRGGTTSKLIFNGSVSPTLSMDQTTPGTTNALSTLQINSTGQVVSMANNLQVNSTIIFSAGKLSINANTLTIKGGVTNSEAEGIRAGANSNLIINSGVSPTLSFDQTTQGVTNAINNLTINSTGQTITLANTLRLLGTHTPTAGVFETGGNYTIASTLTSTANIASGSTSGGYITGDVSVERYIPQNTYRSWRLLASPTSGQTIKQSWQEDQEAGINGVSGYGTNITSNSPSWAANGFDFKTAGPSLFSYDPSGDSLVAVNSTNVSISNEPGYFIYIRGGRGITPSSSIIAGSPTVLRTKGALYTGNQTAVSVAADKYALIGNPYASAIDLRNVATAGGCVGTSFYVWDPKLLGSYSLGAFQTLTPSGGNYVIVPGGGSYGASGSVTNTIQSGAAFFVQSVGSTGSVAISESSKASGSSMVFRPQGVEGGSLSTILYAVTGSVKNIADGTIVFFDDNYSNAVDNYDSRKIGNFGENFSMMKFNRELVAEKRTFPAAPDTIQFAMYSMKKISYQLKIVANNLLQTGMIAFLEDKYLNSFTPVNLGDTTTYDFAVNSNAGSIAKDRFRIVLKPAVVLPVTFTAVSAHQQAANIAIEWQVTNQVNTREYQVEKSANGKSFSLAGTVAALNANSQATVYNWLDEKPTEGANFYRIKSVGTDGSIKYTQVVKVLIGKYAPAFTVTPNPVEGSMMNLQLVNQPKGNYSIRLINYTGQVLFRKTLNHKGGSAAQSVSLPSGLSGGIYQLELLTPGNSRKIQSIIINNK